MFEQKLWELVREEISPTDFEKWVYATPAIEQELGPVDYLKLLECNFSNITDIFSALDSRSEKMYGSPNVIACHNHVASISKKVLERDVDFVLGVREIIAAAPEGDANWNDDDWLELLLISDHADMYPIGVEKSLVSKERWEKTILFDHQMRQEGQGYCNKILARYGRPPQQRVRSNYR